MKLCPLRPEVFLYGKLKCSILGYVNTFIICVQLLLATTVAKVMVQTRKPCSGFSPVARSEKKHTTQQEGRMKTAELLNTFILLSVSSYYAYEIH